MKYILYLLLTTTFLFSQTEQTKKDIPQKDPQQLKSANTSLRNDIDSLKILRDSLEMRLKKELRSLYILRYGEEAGGKIAMGQIWTGMTEEMMQDSWGSPDSVTVNDQKWGRYSQWYYGDIIYFFRDGKLFEWEDDKDADKANGN